MENKEDLINRLLKEGKVNFKEACVLMDKVSNSNIKHSDGQYYWGGISNPFYEYKPFNPDSNQVIC